MLEWIVNHRTAFLATYVEIGRSCAAAKRLQEEHARSVTCQHVSLEGVRALEARTVSKRAMYDVRCAMCRFAAACTGGGRPSVARVATAARRLADKRHYAEAQISALALRLERAYKHLSAGYIHSFSPAHSAPSF